jgi:hypothetical protein
MANVTLDPLTANTAFMMLEWMLSHPPTRIALHEMSEPANGKVSMFHYENMTIMAVYQLKIATEVAHRKAAQKRVEKHFFQEVIDAEEGM